MNKPTEEEFSKIARVYYNDLVSDAREIKCAHLDGSISSWVGLEIKNSRTITSQTKIHLYDTYAQTFSPYMDGRRKKKFKYKKYYELVDLVEDLLKYITISINTDYDCGVWRRKLTKKWAILGFDKKYDEQLNGKIVSTF